MRDKVFVRVPATNDHFRLVKLLRKAHPEIDSMANRIIIEIIRRVVERHGVIASFTIAHQNKGSWAVGQELGEVF